MTDECYKKNILDELIDSALSKMDEDRAQLKLRDYLLSETHNGKLYKYRSSNERNIPLIESQTLYCSEVASFNDPFDCKIGIDILSLIDSLLKKYGSIEELLNLSYDESNESNSKLVERLLRRLTECDVDSIRSQLKEKDLDEIGRLHYLANYLNEARLTDEVAAFERKLSSFEPEVQEKLNNSFYIGCLSSDNCNKLMWAHYAQNYTGFCIEYDYSADFEGGYPLPVIYTHTRPKVPWELAFDHTPESYRKAYKFFIKALFTKDDIWSYEKEWRILIPVSEVHMAKMPPISCIYLGARCSEESKEKIKTICDRKSIPVKQMSLDRGEFDMHFEDII